MLASCAVGPASQPPGPIARRGQVCPAPAAVAARRNMCSARPAFDVSHGGGGRVPVALLPMWAADPMAPGGRCRRFDMGGREAVGATGGDLLLGGRRRRRCRGCRCGGRRGARGLGRFSPVPQALSPTIPMIAAAAARRHVDRRDLMIRPNCPPAGGSEAASESVCWQTLTQCGPTWASIAGFLSGTALTCGASAIWVSTPAEAVDVFTHVQCQLEVGARGFTGAGSGAEFAVRPDG
ncbi:hypothetical protein BN970_01104 [Mycolicibacterium conceptionense]|uniref:Uncharacterized protein n=1 Tax=Mycolicibacterium conceptionense TaxID=451644 RepID=A0A0U1D0W0_9MYCO|nr:hypothetical protein BN970_01104 [Mycolicibacterium conceptionense]